MEKSFEFGVRMCTAIETIHCAPTVKFLDCVDNEVDEENESMRILVAMLLVKEL